MERVTEPELMDTAVDAAEYDAMDFVASDTKFALAALSWLEPGPRRALDVGTGTARIPVLMAERRSDLNIVALDAAAHMLALGAKHIERAGLEGRVELRLQDGKALLLAGERFDLVISNSVVHHIPEPVSLLREVARAVRPGGAVVVRDLVRPDSPEAAWDLVRRVSPHDSPRQQQLFFDSLCAALTLSEVRAALDEAGLGALSLTMVSERHWSAEGRVR
jgi:ubiquinone/menaquinone biosynthesis C-methylase UbiE